MSDDSPAIEVEENHEAMQWSIIPNHAPATNQIGSVPGRWYLVHSGHMGTYLSERATNRQRCHPK